MIIYPSYIGPATLKYYEKPTGLKIKVDVLACPDFEQLPNENREEFMKRMVKELHGRVKNMLVEFEKDAKDKDFEL